MITKLKTNHRGSGLLLLVATLFFMVLCTLSAKTYADNVPGPDSYQMTWSPAGNDWGVTNPNRCFNEPNFSAAEACYDNIITSGGYIGNGWVLNESNFNLYDYLEDVLNTSTNPPSVIAAVAIAPNGCPNEGTPGYTLNDAFGQEYAGWCLIQGVAPPPSDILVCPNGTSPNSQGTCATPPELNAGNPNNCQCVGDPINGGTGNVYLKTIDYQGGAPFVLEFVRSYNSAVAIQGASPDGADQTMGSGWTNNLTGPHLNINVTQQFTTCTDPNDPNDPPINYICPADASSSLVTVWRPDGSQSTFSGQVSNQVLGIPGAMMPMPGATGQLSYGPLPSPISNSYQTVYGYTYLRNDGYTEFYGNSGALLVLQDPHGAQDVYTYDSNSRLLNVVLTSTDAGISNYGYAMISLTYDGLNRIQTMTKCSKYTTSNGCLDTGTYTYTYDNNNNLIQVQYPDNSVVKYVYEDTTYPNALTGVIDENGNRYSTWGYDSQGRADLSYNGNGTSIANDVSITYNGDGSADVVEPTGLSRHLQFTNVNGAVLLASASAPCTMCGDKSEQITYQDASGNPYVSGNLYKTITDFDGNVTQYVIDPIGQELSKTEALGTQYQRTTTTSWNNAVGLPEQITVSNGSGQAVKQTTNCYDFSGGSCADASGSGTVWTKTISDPINNISRTTTYTYRYSTQNRYCNGSLSSIVGPRTDVNQTTNFPFSYCWVGTHLINALSQLWNIGTATDGLLTSVGDPGGVSLAFGYDQRQRMTSKTVIGAKSDAEVTQYTYDLAGNLTKITLPTGGYFQLGYDTAHRLVSVSDSDNESIEYTLDALGNRINEKLLTSGEVTTLERQKVYDNLNHLSQLIGGMGQTATFTDDADGNVLKIADSLGNTTTIQRDALNRTFSIVNPLGGTTALDVDALDHTVGVTTPRQLNTHHSYDAFGDLLEEDDPDRGDTKYTYDLAGNLVSKIDAQGNAENITYDALNRVTQIAYPQDTTQNVTYTYDELGNCPASYAPMIGRLVCVTDSSGTTMYGYDEYGDVAGKGENQGGVTYGYDLSNNLIRVSFGGTDGNLNSVIYVRDGLGKITEVEGQYNSGPPFVLANNITYEPFGPLNSITYGSGLTETRTFDNDYRLTSIVSSGVMNLGFTYDSDNNLKGITDSQDANSISFTQTAGYDAMNHITSWTGKGSVTSLGLTYDADGNRLSKTVNYRTDSYTYDTASNRLLSIKGPDAASFAYTADGGTASDGTYAYSYDVENRVTSVTPKSGGSAVGTYVYNVLGQRTKKVASGTTRFFVYDEAGHLLAEMNSSGTITEIYVWLGNRMIANFTGEMTAASKAYYVHVDQTGAPRVMTNPSKTIGWMWQSDPFGLGAADAISFGSNFNIRLPGQYYESETGNHYNDFREYNPGLGRYLESDPVGLAGGINSYAYSHNNPLTHFDFFGLCDYLDAQKQYWMWVQVTHARLQAGIDQVVAYNAQLNAYYFQYGDSFANFTNGVANNFANNAAQLPTVYQQQSPVLNGNMEAEQEVFQNLEQAGADLASGGPEGTAAASVDVANTIPTTAMNTADLFNIDVSIGQTLDNSGVPPPPMPPGP